MRNRYRRQAEAGAQLELFGRRQPANDDLKSEGARSYGPRNSGASVKRFRQGNSPIVPQRFKLSRRDIADAARLSAILDTRGLADAYARSGELQEG